MTFRAWWRGWVARVWGDEPVRPRGRPTAVLVLDRLPERDVPSGVDDTPPAPPEEPDPPADAESQPAEGGGQTAVSVGLMRFDLGYGLVNAVSASDGPVAPAPRSPSAPSAWDAIGPPNIPPTVSPAASVPPARNVVVTSATPSEQPWVELTRIRDWRNVVVTATARTESGPPGVGGNVFAVERPPTAPQPAGGIEGGRAVRADGSAFRISGPLSPTETVRVHYTLAAHDAAGTTAVSGTVTLTPAAGVATVPVTAVPTVRPPELFTLVVGDHPANRPAPSATLFVVPPPQAGDAALLEAHRAGRSAEAFNTLVRRHGPAVARAAERVVGNRADVQDVSQRVFLELSRFRGRVTGTLTAWLRAVSRNTALAFLRAKRRRLRYELQAAKGEALEAPPPADDALLVALTRLPPELGQAVRLRYLDGYTQQEAAELAGVPRGTLSRRAADGLRALRLLLADGEHSPAGRQ